MFLAQHKAQIKALMKKYDHSKSGNLNVTGPALCSFGSALAALLQSALWPQKEELKELLKDLNNNVEPTEEEVVAADEAAAAATRVQASIRGRQARAKALAEGAPATEADPDASAEVSAEELEAEARAADEAAEAAIRVQASIRGRQSRAKMKKAE